MPGAARAQDPVEISASSLRAWVDGRGALQVSILSSPGEFAPADEQPARAGLEIVQGTAYSPAGDPARTVLSAPAVTDTGDAVTSRYRVGALEVTERVTGVDGDSPELRLE